MPKQLLLLILMTGCCAIRMTAAGTDSLLHALHDALDHKTEYLANYEHRLEEMKRQLADNKYNAEQTFLLNRKIYNAYQSFQSDSALLYTRRALSIARQLHHIEYDVTTRIDLSYMLWQTGHFFESIQNLNSIDVQQLKQTPINVRTSYLAAYKRLYRYYADMHNDQDSTYYRISNAYRDSALALLPPESKEYKIMTIEKLTDEGETTIALQLMQQLLRASVDEDHERAIFTNIMANIYRKTDNVQMQKRYYALSAISDCKNAVTENTSMQELALILYQENDIDNAYRCVQSSMEDAIFCNSRFRTYEITKIFPVIDRAYKSKITKQQNELRLYLIIVSLLLTCVALAVFFVYKQMKRISRMRSELYRTNLKLNEINKELQETNRVKEAYLGRFIDLCSGYIDKWDDYRRGLKRIAGSGKLDSLYADLKSTTFIESEVKSLNSLFDCTFLDIFPTFVKEFDALFPPKERQVEKRSHLLSTEQRIYALIRLGIDDSARIAGFLRCSITTVYTYRSKLRNKSLIGDELDKRVMSIGK